MQSGTPTEAMLGSSTTDRRRRKKDSDRDRDRDRPESKDKERHRSTRKHRPSSKERDRDTSTRERPRAPQSSSSQSHSSSSRKMSVPVVPEMERRNSNASPGASRISLPYPTFSKAHSKEAVGGKEEIAKPGISLYTPDPTDIGQGKQGESGGGKVDGQAGATGAAVLTWTLACRPVSGEPRAWWLVTDKAHHQTNHEQAQFA